MLKCIVVDKKDKIVQCFKITISASDLYGSFSMVGRPLHP